VIDRVDAHIRRHALIEPCGEVLCLVSGGADSTCLFHVLRELGYRVSALHVDHGLRGRESDDDAAWCAERFGAEVVRAEIPRTTEAELRDVRYSFRPELLRATGHTLSDQVETILFRLVSSGSTKGIKVRREDGVVRPLLCLWREDTEAYCRERGLEWRVDSTNAATARGLIRERVLPLLERIHPAARGRGYGLRGLADLCRLLLESTPAVTLFVRRENTAAIGLYDALGMRRVLEYRSVLF